ncbi:flagellar basal body-associated FliL family protein [Saliterribacillus persicus]|uniref:Flagellar FliL protein n=1 Tax=Saliterribacillus persicus TaxID=930114 RepID=A0A368XT98_9BACI|nr:flagellar basal body-associated FliL family protein [Saliterribacillus persicus]RCW70709.1 flagellar FliL protein [Saliterribacillus persicus]
MNPKLLKILIISLTTVTIIGIAAFVWVLFFSGDDSDGELSLEKVVEYSYTTTELRTDLKDGNFVLIQFQFVTDSKKAKEEIQMREFQVKNEFIKESVVLTEEDFKNNLAEIEDNLKTIMNEQMNEGKITDVYIVSKVIQ